MRRKGNVSCLARSCGGADPCCILPGEIPPIGGREIPSVFGNTTGLKSSQTARLERLYRRKVPPSELVTPELARAMTEISREITRQIGCSSNGAGPSAPWSSGPTGRSSPDLDEFRLRRKKLRGIRCLHTQPQGRGVDIRRLDRPRPPPPRPDGSNRRPAGRSSGADIPGPRRSPNPEGRTTEVLPAVPLSRPEVRVRFPSPRWKRRSSARRGNRSFRPRASGRSWSPSRAGPRTLQEEAMAELMEMARSDDIVLDAVIQRPHEINPRTLLGAGKIGRADRPRPAERGHPSLSSTRTSRRLRSRRSRT